MLLGHKSGEILLKLGLVRIVPIATALTLIYAISVALLEKRSADRISKPIAATIVVGVLGLVFDAGAWVLAFNRHGP